MNTVIFHTILLVFSLQTLLLNIFLILNKEHRLSNSLLSIVLFLWMLIAVNLSVYAILDYYSLNNWIPFLRLEMLYGLGPSVYVYTKAVTSNSYRFRSRDFLHFVPLFLEFLYYRSGFYREGVSSLGFYNSLFILQQWGGVIWSSVYLYLAIGLLRLYDRWVRDQYSNLKDKTLEWFYKPIVLLSTFWLLWFVIRLLDVYALGGRFKDYYFLPMYLLLSSVILYIAVQAVYRKRVATYGFTAPQEKNIPNVANIQALKPLALRLQQQMQQEKLYLDPEFNLKMFAESVNVPSAQISKAINTVLDKNFHQFTNEYRVDAFKKRLQRHDAYTLTLLAHAFESGFSSKSTFNHIFKKYTGITPTQYYKQLQKNTSENRNSDDQRS